MSSGPLRGAAHALAFLAIALGCSHAPRAPPVPSAEFPLLEATHARLHSRVLNEERIFDVSVPPSYARGDGRYPVLCLVDGEAHFAQATAVTRYLAERLQAPELLVVSIPNPDLAHRHRDLAPVPKPGLRDGGSGRLVSETMPTAGGADTFLRFLAEELLPWVDAHYRTEPFRVLFGHSLGGLFAVRALGHRPELFRGIVAASPAVFWNDGEPASSVPGVASGLAPLERSLFFAVGDEPDGVVGPVRRFDAALSAVPADRLRHRFVRLPDERHSATPLLTLYDGLKFVFEGWPLAEKLLYASFVGAQVSAEIFGHYARLSSRFGFTVRPPRGVLTELGMKLLDAKELDAGLDVMKRAAEFYPGSVAAQDALAEALVRNGKLPEAIGAEERAIALATEAGDTQRAQALRQRLSEWMRSAATATQHAP